MVLACKRSGSVNRPDPINQVASLSHWNQCSFAGATLYFCGW